jgi:hypothetical protein
VSTRIMRNPPVVHADISKPIRSVFIDSSAQPEHPPIPRTDAVRALDARITSIRQFLRTTTRPPDLSESEFQAFVNYMTKFFVLESKLWRRHPQGRHQVYINEPGRYQLI